MIKKIGLTALFCLSINSVFAADSTGIPECDRFIQYSEQIVAYLNNPELTNKVYAEVDLLKEHAATAKTKKEKDELSQNCSKAFTLLSDAVTE